MGLQITLYKYLNEITFKSSLLNLEFLSKISDYGNTTISCLNS